MKIQPAKKKKPGKAKFLVIPLIIAVICATVLIPLIMNGPNKNYNHETVQISDITITVNGSGVIESSEEEMSYAKIVSEVDVVFVEVGDEVKKGDVLAYLSSDNLEIEIEQQEDLIDSLQIAVKASKPDATEKIKSITEGRIKQIFAQTGLSIENVMGEHKALALISTDDKLKVLVTLDDISGFNIGQSVLAFVNESLELDAMISQIDTNASMITVVFNDDADYEISIGQEIEINSLEGESIGNGEAQANHPLLITADSGVVEKIYYGENDWVKEGKTLFLIDDNEYSQDYLDLIDELSEAREKLEEKQALIKELVVRTDIDGYISTFNISEGMLLSKGHLMYSVKGTDTNSDSMEVSFDIDEYALSSLEIGNSVNVHINALNKDVEGVVKSISKTSNVVNEVSYFTVTAEIDNGEGLIIGMSAEVTAIDKFVEGAATIPLSWLMFDDNDRPYVHIYGANQKAVKKYIETGLSDGTYVEITSGLVAGEVILQEEESSGGASILPPMAGN